MLFISLVLWFFDANQNSWATDFPVVMLELSRIKAIADTDISDWYDMSQHDILFSKAGGNVNEI